MSCGSFWERRRENIFSVSLHLKDLITIEIIYRNALNVKRYTGRSTFIGIVFFLALWPAQAASELVCRVAMFVGLQFPQHRRTNVEIEGVALAESGDDPVVTRTNGTCPTDSHRIHGAACCAPTIPVSPVVVSE